MNGADHRAFRLLSPGKSQDCLPSCPRCLHPPSKECCSSPSHLQHAVPEQLSNQSTAIARARFPRCPTYVMQENGVQGLLSLKLVSATTHVTQSLLEAGLHFLCLSLWATTMVHYCIIINSYWKCILENVVLHNHI